MLGDVARYGDDRYVSNPQNDEGWEHSSLSVHCDISEEHRKSTFLAF